MHKAVTIAPPSRKRGGHNWSPGWEWETKGELPFRTDWLATVLLQVGSEGSGWWVFVALDLDESHIITCQFSPTRRPFLYPVGGNPRICMTTSIRKFMTWINGFGRPECRSINGERRLDEEGQDETKCGR